jgi:DNA modification methylase
LFIGKGRLQMPNLQIQYVSPDRLRPYPGNARSHSRKQIKLIADSIKRFGFTNPLLVTDDFEVVAGHGRLQAAKSLGMQLVPVVALSSLSEADKKALVIADNRIAELAGWDRDILAIEYQALEDLQFEDIEVTGFSLGEIDTVLDEASEKKPVEPGPEDDLPAVVAAPVSRMGDLWTLGSHRLLCGDARSEADYARLLEGEIADLVLTDPPFNCRIDGNVSGLGKVRHTEFAMASGEMSEAEFTAFLSTFLGCTKAHSKDGAILFVFMDWRHLFELTCAGREQGLALKNLIVWVKDNAGMGTFYRSKHELIFVFKNGDARHLNTFELGQHGRYRSNVFEYAGVNTFRTGRLNELAMHPTVKPVAMLADAIRDVTRRGAIVLDPFAGSGSTLIAAEKTGRHARCIEYEPKYCDVIVRRWQAYTGKAAEFNGIGLTFEDLEGARASNQKSSAAKPLPSTRCSEEIPQ